MCVDSLTQEKNLNRTEITQTLSPTTNKWGLIKQKKLLYIKGHHYLSEEAVYRNGGSLSQLYI